MSRHATAAAGAIILVGIPLTQRVAVLERVSDPKVAADAGTVNVGGTQVLRDCESLV